jgi:hypothetical protein
MKNLTAVPEPGSDALECFSIFHHQLHIFQGLDTPQWIAIYGNDIRVGSWPPLRNFAEWGSACAGLAFC